VDPTSKASLLEAVNALVAADNAPQLYSDLLGIMDAATRFGARFTGEREILNPLLNLAMSNRDQFLRVVSLIESKRAAAGASPLSAPPDTTYDKTSYMREFMAQKRERERRAVEIENMMRGDRSPLKGRARLEFMQTQSARWKAQRDDMLAAAKQRAGSQGLKRAQEQDLIAQFWQRIDRELDELEQLARAELQPGARKAR
jgi:hypothetical protein